MAAKNTPGQQARRLRQEITRVVTLNYLLFLPSKYPADGKQQWPLMLFLHGAGERGNDLDRVKKHGPPKLVARRKAFPFVVASPQCRPDERWRPEDLTVLLDDLVKRYRIDEDRIYVTGLSMGGYGTWALAGASPERFAAIAPICGGGQRADARAIAQAKLPTWVFHGAKDQTVPLEESQRLVDIMKRYDGDPQFTIYPKARHDSWTATYANPKLYEWLLSHRRGDRG